MAEGGQRDLALLLQREGRSQHFQKEAPYAQVEDPQALGKLRSLLSTAAESVEISIRNEHERERLKICMTEDRRELARRRAASSRRRRELSRRSDSPCGGAGTLQRSPFLVDLVAENERIDEENCVRLRAQLRKQRELERRREEAKNDIILRALQEGNELDALRREKRKILEEERRLRAAIGIEKTNAHRKEDRMAAERAERRRKTAKVEYRRTSNKDRLDERAVKERDLLRIKHDISAPPDNTFSSYGTGENLSSFGVTRW